MNTTPTAAAHFLTPEPERTAFQDAVEKRLITRWNRTDKKKLVKMLLLADRARVGAAQVHAEKALLLAERDALAAQVAQLLAALEVIYANAAESPERIRVRISPAIAAAKGSRP